MIRWLVQTTDAHPALKEGRIPAGLLTPAETRRFHALHSEKRRRDWLLGRWTAKRLLQATLVEGVANAPALSEIVIDNDARGVPIAPLPHPLTEGQLSISHSRGRAFCAVSLEAYPVGADLEYVETRENGFVTDFFSRAERRLVEVAPEERRPLLETAIWSGKEAALKALQLGLSVDTRSVTCLFDAGGATTGWTHFEILVDRQRLPRCDGPLKGWWRVADGFVYTLVAPASARVAPAATE